MAVLLAAFLGLVFDGIELGLMPGNRSHRGVNGYWAPNTGGRPL